MLWYMVMNLYLLVEWVIGIFLKDLGVRKCLQVVFLYGARAFHQMNLKMNYLNDNLDILFLVL